MCSRSACRKARPRPSRNSRRPSAHNGCATGNRALVGTVESDDGAGCRRGSKKALMKAALLGGFAIVLAGTVLAPTAQALPAAPLPEAAAVGHMALLPVRHHRHHGYWRPWPDRYAPYSSPATHPPPPPPEKPPPPPHLPPTTPP